MNDEVRNETNVMADTSTVQRKIESIVFNTLKSKIKGHIYAKMEEKTDEDEIDTLYVKVESNGLVYTDRLQLPGDTFEMVSQNDSFAETLGLMIFDNFVKYINNKFYIQDKPMRYKNYQKREK